MSTEMTRVLVVTDSEESLNRLAYEVLPQAGYEVIVADANTAPPPVDIVVADVTRMLVSPLGPLQTQRELGCNAPALLVAPRLSEALIPGVFALNVHNFLTSPATDDALLDKIGDVLEAARQNPTEDTPVSQPQDAMPDPSQNTASDQTKDAFVRNLQDVEALTQIGRMLTTVDDVDTVLSRIVDAAVFLARAEEGALFMANEKGQLYLRAEKNIGEREAQALSVLSEDSLAAQVFQTGEPIMRGSGEEEALKVKTGYLVQALINIPVIIGQHIVGVLAVYNNSLAPFEHANVRMLDALAVFAAIALEKAHTVTGLKERIDAAAEASRRALITIDSLQSPIEALDAQIETLLSGALGTPTESQADALTRMRAAITGLKETSNTVHTLAQDFQ